MALLIPDTPGHCTGSERQIFRRMEHELDDDWIVLHSMALLRHRTKIAGEADFVVLSTKGIFVIEVKGGTVSCHNGLWRFENPVTRQYYEKNESPFVQANQALFALKDALDKVPAFQELLIGSGVMMPFCTFDAEGPEIERAILFDARHTPRSLRFYIGALASHWDQVYRERHGRQRRPPTRPEIAALRQLLRPDLESIPALATIFSGVEERLLYLTGRQIRAVRGMENNPRTLITGRAGTGKTVIAADRAVRLAGDNNRVLYVCFNQLLARHVASGLAHNPAAANVQVRHLHGLFHETITKAGLAGRVKDQSVGNDELFGRIFPEVFIEAAVSIDLEPADVLIVDEAQDLLTPANLDAFDLLVKDGLRKGRWSIFLDPLQNIYGAQGQEAMSLLEEAGYASYELRENCRNTREIATQCSIISGVDMALEGAIPGVQCDCIYYENHADLLQKLDAEVRRLLRGGVEAKDMVILSTRRRENSGIADRPEIGGLVIRDLAEEFNLSRGLHFSTMHSFKGLERKVVLAIDLDRIGEQQVALLHYAGLSRAVALLRPFVLIRERDAYTAQARNFGRRITPGA